MNSPNQLSFLPDDYLERKAQRRSNVICASLFFIVVVGIMTARNYDERKNKAMDARHVDVDRRYAEAAKRIEQVGELQEKQKRMAHQAELSGSLLERVPRSKILAEITNGLPAGVSLLDFGLDSKVRAPKVVTKSAFEQKKDELTAKKAAPAAPEPRKYDVTVRLVGIAPTDVQAAQFMRRLSESNVFSEVNLVVSDEYAPPGSDEKLRKFELEMTVDTEADVNLDYMKSTRTAAVEVK